MRTIRIYQSFRKVLAEKVIEKWEEVTGEKRTNKKINEYLSVSNNEEVKTEDEKNQWTVRDAILNCPEVRAYIIANKSFNYSDAEAKFENYNGYRFYQSIYLKGSNCSLDYLETYALFINYPSFHDFVKNVVGIKDGERSLQEAELKHAELPSKILEIERLKKNSRQYEFPQHLAGLYTGYYIRPRKPAIGAQEIFSELNLLICDDNSVYLRTTNTEGKNSFANNCYEGYCYLTNLNTLHIDFITVGTSDAYLFGFVFDIQSEQHQINFENNRCFLKGIYCKIPLKLTPSVQFKLTPCFEATAGVQKHG